MFQLLLAFVLTALNPPVDITGSVWFDANDDGIFQDNAAYSEQIPVERVCYSVGADDDADTWTDTGCVTTFEDGSFYIRVQLPDTPDAHVEFWVKDKIYRVHRPFFANRESPRVDIEVYPDSPVPVHVTGVTWIDDNGDGQFTDTPTFTERTIVAAVCYETTSRQAPFSILETRCYEPSIDGSFDFDVFINPTLRTQIRLWVEDEYFASKTHAYAIVDQEETLFFRMELWVPTN